jgi:hypothetical protein
LDVFVKNRDERLCDGFFAVHSGKHFEELLIGNEEIPRKNSSFLFEIFIKSFFDLFNSDVNLGDLFNHAATAIDSGCLIAHFFVE